MLIKLPKGFRVKIRSYSDVRLDKVIELISDKYYPYRPGFELESNPPFCYGYIEMIYVGDDTYETHSYLDEQLRGKGLGAMLYAKAIQWCHRNGYKIRSSGCTSKEAKRVWKGDSIRNYFRIRKLKKRLWGVPRTVWYAYPK
jgi:GNAT superfamily N-acetyltransferase